VLYKKPIWYLFSPKGKSHCPRGDIPGRTGRNRWIPFLWCRYWWSIQNWSPAATISLLWSLSYFLYWAVQGSCSFFEANYLWSAQCSCCPCSRNCCAHFGNSHCRKFCLRALELYFRILDRSFPYSKGRRIF